MFPLTLVPSPDYYFEFYNELERGSGSSWSDYHQTICLNASVVITDHVMYVVVFVVI